jgi:excisionase family DNA binding protein
VATGELPLSFFSNYNELMDVLADHTVLPPGPLTEGSQLKDLADILDGDTELLLVTPDGQTFKLSRELRNVLSHASRALGTGHGVTLEPRSAVLSTQAAADMLGVSRPTLVKLLKSGEIAFTQPGRHRRVQLKDLLEYQQRIRQRRRRELEAMTDEAAEDNGYRHINGFTETR